MKNASRHLKKGMASLTAPFLSVATYAQESNPGGGQSSSVAASLDDFPNLHPLIVHFAIVLILVGAVLQLVNVYFMKREIAWIAFAVAASGVVTAILAGTTFHPHVHELSEHAKQVMGRHDHWAEWTMYLGGAGAVLQGLNLFFLTDKRWAVGLVAAVLLGAG